MTLPALLLVPGMLNTPAVFDRVQAELRALPWPGGTPPRCVVADVREGASIAAMAGHAWATVAAEVPPEAPLAVAGYSMGGYVALQMLAEAPRPVHGLGLLATSARADTPEGAALRARAIAAIERDFARYVGTLSSLLLTPAALADPALLAAVRADMQAVGAAAAVRQQRAAAARADRRDFVRGLALPVQVLGAADDKVTPPALAQEIAQLVPGAQLERVEGCGHLLPFEQPARVAAGLRRLLLRAAAHAAAA
jgi:pimeloyl-ACP methyl ester carboxylesterase